MIMETTRACFLSGPGLTGESSSCPIILVVLKKKKNKNNNMETSCR